MTRGRRPKPTALRMLEGNRGKRGFNRDEPKPDAVLPEPPPEWVARAKVPPEQRQGNDGAVIEALAEWHRRGPSLVRLGVLTELDAPAFRTYCEAWGRYIDATAAIDKLGEVVRAPSGYPIPNPYRAVANKAIMQCQAFWTEFGMTPSSRTRIHAKPGGSKQSNVDKFMNEKPKTGRRLA